MPPDVGEPPVSTVAFDRDSMATWYAKQHLKVDEGIEEVVYLPTNAGEREIRFLEINKEMLDPDDHLEPINYGVDMGTGVSRRPKPASDRRAISGHLPGAFRPTGHPTALPPKESVDHDRAAAKAHANQPSALSKSSRWRAASAGRQRLRTQRSASQNATWATLPEEIAPDAVTLEQALGLIAARPPKKRKRR